jgi:hypothetical protein
VPARRCDIGCESWPDKAIFSTCLDCGEPTERVGNIEPTISDEDAEVRLLYVQFDRYYERWCAAKGQPVEGPLPC